MCYVAVVNGRTVVREARRRAGITQAELAERVGTTQSSIARLENGGTEASLARIDLLVRACGLDLVIELDEGRVDPDEWQQALRNLAMTPDERLHSLLAAVQFAAAGREAVRRR